MAIQALHEDFIWGESRQNSKFERLASRQSEAKCRIEANFVWNFIFYINARIMGVERGQALASDWS